MLVVRWLTSALGFLLMAEVVPGIEVASLWTALVLALMWGLISITIKPVLLILTLPFNLLTFGLFTFVLNGLLLWFLGSIIDGFQVAGFLSDFLGALFLSLVSLFAQWFLMSRHWD